jgi:hypothetical protein
LDRSIGADLVRMGRGADPLQHATEDALHLSVARGELARLDVKHPVANRSGARVHADDPPAPVEQDGAGPHLVETHLDPSRKHGASGRGDGPNPFEMVARAFELTDFPVLHLGRPPLDRAANFARHEFEGDETSHLERVPKLGLNLLPIDSLAVQEHSLVNEIPTAPYQWSTQVNPEIVLSPPAALISCGDFRDFGAHIADRFFLRAETDDAAAETSKRVRESSERLRP